MATRTAVEKAQLVVSRPEKGDTNTYVIKPGMTVAVAGFTFSDGVATIRGEDLVIQFPDGSQIVLQDFVEVAQYNNPPVVVFEDGTVLPGSDVLLQVAALDGAPVDIAALDAKMAAIEPAAGPAGGAAPSNLVSGGLGSASNFAIGSIGGDGVAVSARPDNVDFGRATDGGIQVGGPTGDGNGGTPPNGGNTAPNALNATLVVDDDAPATAINIPAPTDANGDPLTITITSLPGLGTLLLNGVPVTVGQTLTVAQLQALTFDPNDGQLGNTSFTFTVSDGQATDVGTVNIVVNDNGGGNQAPNAFDATLVVDDDAAATALNIPAPTDANGDALTITINSLPNLGVLMLNGVPVTVGQVLTAAQLQALTFDPANGQFGNTSFTYTVSDGQATDVGTVNINVTEQNANQAPNAFDATLVVDDDAAATALNIPAPTDPNGDTLTVTINSLPNLGVLMLNGVAVVAGQVLTVAQLQALTFDPANGQFGNTSFTYTVNDGNGGSDVGTVNITVNEQDPANQAPNAFDATVIMNEDAGATALNIPAPTDADGDTLTVTINGLPGLGTLTLNGVAVTIGQVLTVAQLQSLQFTPNANANGVTSFTYTVNDGQATDTATVNININPVNDNPNAEPNGFPAVLTVDDDAGATPINIQAPTDADGDTLSITINSLPNAALGTLLLNGVAVVVGQVLTVAQLQALTFDPNNGQFGTTTFNYTVNDGNGGSDTATVTLNVVEQNANQAPNAFDATLVVDDDAAATALNIPAPTDPNGDTLTVTINSLPNLGVLMLNGVAVAAGQVLTVAQLQALTFDPANGQFGNTSFTYSVNDGQGGSDTATVNIVVNEQDPANQPPNAFDATLVVDDDAAATALNIPAPTDADGDALTVTINTLPNLGVLMLNGVAVAAGQVLTVAQLQALTFDPANGQFGNTSFTYAVNDGQGGSDSATVSITVNEQDTQPVNNNPIALDQTVVMDEDAGNVALNILRPFDQDGDTLSVRIDSLPSLGTLTLNGVAVHVGQILTVDQLQSLSFVTALDANGTTSFSYTVNDGNGGFDSATVNIVVNPVVDLPPNHAPIALDQTVVMDEDSGTVLLNVLRPFDQDGDTLSVTIDSLPHSSLGSLVLNGVAVHVGQVLTVEQLQSLSFNTAPDANGTSSFHYTVNDGNGGFDGATVNIVVNPVANIAEPTMPVALEHMGMSLLMENAVAATGDEHPVTGPMEQLLAEVHEITLPPVAITTWAFDEAHVEVDLSDKALGIETQPVDNSAYNGGEFIAQNDQVPVVALWDTLPAQPVQPHQVM